MSKQIFAALFLFSSFTVFGMKSLEFDEVKMIVFSCLRPSNRYASFSLHGEHLSLLRGWKKDNGKWEYHNYASFADLVGAYMQRKLKQSNCLLSSQKNYLKEKLSLLKKEVEILNGENSNDGTKSIQTALDILEKIKIEEISIKKK